MELKQRCRKCGELSIHRDKDKLVCSNCNSYWERDEVEFKWRYKGTLDNTQQATTESLHGPRRIKGTTQQGDTSKKLKCPKCDYEWNSNSKMFWVTCPQCQLKFKKEV